MASRLAAWVVMLGAVSPVGGCGKAEGGSAPITQAELPAKIADLVCDSVASCCKSGGFAFDPTACKTGYTKEVQKDLGRDASQRVTYDAQAAGDCLAAASSSVQCGEVKGADIAACERIFVGQVALGQPCTRSQECAPTNTGRASCDSPGGGGPSVCISMGSSAPHGKAGQACSGTCDLGNDCSSANVPSPGVGQGAPLPEQNRAICFRDEGLYCSSGLCAPLVPLGEGCDDYQACRAPGFCDFNSQRCKAPQPSGAPCQSDNECESENCADAPPGPGVDPVFNQGRVCVSGRNVTAERCAKNFANPAAPAASGSDPGSAGPAPAAR